MYIFILIKIPIILIFHMYIIDMNRKKDISDIPVVFYATENTFIN